MQAYSMDLRERALLASALIGVIMLCDTNIELPPPRVKLAK